MRAQAAVALVGAPDRPVRMVRYPGCHELLRRHSGDSQHRVQTLPKYGLFDGRAEQRIVAGQLVHGLPQSGVERVALAREDDQPPSLLQPFAPDHHAVQAHEVPER